MRRIGWIALLIVAVAADLLAAQDGTPSSTSPATGGGLRVERTAFVMGTELRIEVPTVLGRDRALTVSEVALAEVERIEALLSTWRSDTPLSELNRAPLGRPSNPPEELRALLDAVLAWVETTDGAFDPRVGALIDAWDLRGEGRIPTASEIAAALEGAGDSGMRADTGGVTRHHSAAWIDAGGFGKGAALASASERLRAEGIGAALLDLGGQLLLLGSPADHPSGWSVDVAHPSRRDEGVAELILRDASVATSGVSERGIHVGDEYVGHILDPRTGMPVPRWGSVTVVSSDPLLADVLSTALYVLGPEDGLALVRAMPDTGALFLTETPSGLEASWNVAMERWLVDPSALQHPDLNDPPQGDR